MGVRKVKRPPLRGLKINKIRHWRRADFPDDGLWMRILDVTCFPSDVAVHNNERSHWWVASVVDGDMYPTRVSVAFASLRRDDNDGTVAHFVRCGVIPNARGRSLQKKLIRVRLAWCRRHGIRTVRTYVAVGNQTSFDNLIACGFRRVRRRGRFIYMEKELRP